MRVIGGRFRGKRLISPPGDFIRPTSDRAREALFNILEHGEPSVRGARFVDLFAGTGAVGIEALSRGAGDVVLIENDPQALGLLRRNLQGLGDQTSIRVLERDATRLGRARAPADLVFLDPPYHAALASQTLESLHAGGWLSAGARIVVELEHTKVLPAPEALTLEDERRYGAARFVFFRHEPT